MMGSARFRMYILVIVILFPASCGAQEQVENLIKDYLSVIKDRPTLYNSGKFDCCGEGELQFEYKVCEEKGWVPDKGEQYSENCVNFTNERAKMWDTVPSLMFVWIRSHIPIGQKIEIVHVEKGPPSTPYIVNAVIGGVEVEFSVFIGGEFHSEVSLQAIEGKGIMEIFEDEIASGFSPSSLLETPFNY